MSAPAPDLAAHLAAAGLDTPALQAAGLAVLGHFRQGDPLATLAAAGGGGPSHGTALDFLGTLRWLDGTPLLGHVEPYRRAIFEALLDTAGEDGRPRYNLALLGRAKKNAKSLDLVLMALVMVLRDAVGGSQVFLLASDEEQAGDDLDLAKKLLAANPHLEARLAVRQKELVRTDGGGAVTILPAQDVAGAHGKTYTLCGFDEIHTYRDWNIIEALQPDPTRARALMVFTSYASLFHKPGVPLFDMLARGRAGTDPRMLLSWYAADFTTDPACADLPPERRANPSMGGWAEPDYLEQQKRRLPAHKYRRLHLNLPGLPEGSAFQPDPVFAAIARGLTHREPEPGVTYSAFVDMSGGSSDDAALAVGFCDADGRAVVCRVLNQGQPPPFDPRLAVGRFAAVLARYAVRAVEGDRYAGETFRADFERHGVRYDVCEFTASQLYEALEPPLNGGRVALPDLPELEQQLLGLLWKGGKITHPGGEHDDWANAAAGLVRRLLEPPVTDVPLPVAGGVENVYTGLAFDRETYDWLLR